MDIPAAADILGTIGAVCWSIQLIPQIIINYRRHNTIGLQPAMMLLWASAGVPLGGYNITEKFNIALRVQPQILTFLSLLTWAQCGYYGSYGRRWSIYKCLLALFLLGFLMGGIEVALIFALKVAKKRDLQWPLTFMAILSTVLLAAGVLRHYWDIYKERTVRGISFIFVGIDAAGDFFSLISILFQPTIDILGMIIYITELTLWIGVFICGGYFNLLPWAKSNLRQRRQKREEQSLRHSDRGDADGLPALHPDGSSTSVFRTPSSATRERAHGEGFRMEFLDAARV